MFYKIEAGVVVWSKRLNTRMTPLTFDFRRVLTVLILLSARATPTSLEIAKKTLAEELAVEKKEQKDLKRSRTLELELNCKDGTTVWTEVKMSFLRDQDGHPVKVLGVARDIAERKR